MVITFSRRGIFSVIVVAVLLLGMKTWADDNNLSPHNLFDDWDQDGLTNSEEGVWGTDHKKKDTDGDGYADGLEVEEGYNPLVPAPGDRLVPERGKVLGISTSAVGSLSGEENLTVKMSREMAEKMQEVEKIDDFDTADIDAIIAKTLDKKMTFEDLPMIDENDIRIVEVKCKKKDSEEECTAKKKAAVLEYLTVMSYIFVQSIPFSLSSSNDLLVVGDQVIKEVVAFSTSLSNISYFKKISVNAQDVIAKMEQTPVPEEMVDFHIKGLQLMHFAVSLRDSYKMDQTDPMKNLIQISRVQSFILLSMDFMTDMEGYFTSYGIIVDPFAER